MRARFVLISLIALLPQCVVAAGQEVGDWSLDESMCDQNRIVFTASGHHESRVMEDGSWRTLASAPYQREGNILVVQNPELTERLEVREESSQRIVLRNVDSEEGRDIAVSQVTLVRCPEAS